MEKIQKDYGYLLVDKGHIYDIEGEMTDNGVVFKDYEAFKTGVGICYISEHELEDLDERLAELEYAHNESSITSEYLYLLERERIILSVGETRQSIIDQVRQAFGDDYMLTDEQVEYFASGVFQMADWACIATYLAESFDLDDLIEFDHNYNPEGRRLFSQFQYEAVMHDMYPSEYKK